MKPRTLNLLHHPRRMWSVERGQLFGLGLGMVLVLGLGWLLQSQHASLLLQQQQRAQQWQAQAQQQAQQRAWHERERKRRQQQALWRSAHEQEQQRLALQAALQQEAGRGLRLMRWQADGQHMWLQGQVPHSGELPGLQTRLGLALGQAWTLQSLSAGAAAQGVVWTLEAPWPPVAAPRGAVP